LAFVAMVSVGVTMAACGGATTTSGRPTTTSPSAAPTERWDLVWFSDSSGFDLASLWAERIEQDLGVEVRVYDFSRGAEAGSAVAVLDRIETEPEVQDALATAEVIGLNANPAGAVPGDEGADVCVTTSRVPRDPPEPSSIEDFEPYAELLRSIYEHIFELRAGQPTIVRAVDHYNPVIGPWRAAGIEPECTAHWEAVASTVRQVASEYSVPTASMYDTFNGPGHDEDPVEKGLIGSDGEHPSDKGKAVQVDVLDALGYEPIRP
ncbi:MAG TPA: SGNH/GDSL hydrolase family protein, partial [Actinomycetota bacterium]